jgi:hypothetical protein
MISAPIDISNYISSNHDGIRPFVLFRNKSDGEATIIVPYWLEYSENYPPSEAEITATPEMSRFQTLANYQSLPRLESDSRIYKAVAERRPEWAIAVCKLRRGCLWTMMPDSRITHSVKQK